MELERILLLVDDEENIIRSLTRLLRRDGYTILSANSGHDALALLERQAVGVIISDQRMPGMNGVEFLQKVKEKYPDNVRIVLSGYTDLNSITNAINEGAIYKFLTKPWDDELLRKNIREAFVQYELYYENKRLRRELTSANEKLSQLNADLRCNIKQKIRVFDINTRTLQLCRNLIENLPLGVLGIGENGVIVVANLKAHELLWPGSGSAVGRFAEDALCGDLATAYLQFRDNSMPLHRYIEVGRRPVEVFINPSGPNSGTCDAVLVLIVREGLE